MARPKKDGLDWFQHDVNASSGEGVQKLEAEFGPEGYAFFFKCLEKIFRKGGYWQVSDAETCRIFGRNLMGWSLECAEQNFFRLVSSAIRAGLFDGNEWDERRCLTSDDIQRRCGTMLRKRVKKEITLPAVSSTFPANIGQVSGAFPAVSSPISRVYPEEIQRREEETHTDSSTKTSDEEKRDPEIKAAVEASLNSVSRSYPEEAGTAPEPPRQESIYDDPEVERFADEHFQPLGPEIEQSGLYANTGRRPMKKFPEIWISPVELQQALTNLEQRGISDKERRRIVFQKVQAKVKTYLAQGKQLAWIDAVSWLTGWALTETLREEKASIDLARSESYLR